MDYGARQPEFESWLLCLLVHGLTGCLASVACCPIYFIQIFQQTGEKGVKKE